jgi:hypothetical protein
VLEPHSLVQLLVDREDILAGSYGNIVEQFGDTCEVEFCDEHGTIARILVEAADLAQAEPVIDKCS